MPPAPRRAGLAIRDQPVDGSGIRTVASDQLLGGAGIGDAGEGQHLG